MNEGKADPCSAYLKSSTADAPLSVYYNNVCYLGRQSIEQFKYSDYTFLGFKETEHWAMPATPIIGIDSDTPVAAIVDDSVIKDIQKELLNNHLNPDQFLNQPVTAVIPFILAVVAIDAGLIATMWAVALQ